MSKLVFNEPLPPKIRKALIRKAKADHVRVEDVAGAMLASRFGMGWSSSRPYRDEKGAIDKIRVPDELHSRIREQAFRIQDGTIRGVVLSVLSELLETGEVSPTRRPRKG